MKNIETILGEFEIEIPEDKKEALKKAVAENYYAKAEADKKLSRLEADRDNWKSKTETAEETLKGFDGVDVEKMKQDIEGWKKKAEEAESAYEAKLKQRDFDDIVKATIAEYKGKGEQAVKAYLDLDALMNSQNQKEDIANAIKSLKEGEKTSFLFEHEGQGRGAKFTGSFKGKNGGGAMTKDDFKKMSLDERIKLKSSEPELYNALSK